MSPINFFCQKELFYKVSRLQHVSNLKNLIAVLGGLIRGCFHMEKIFVIKTFIKKGGEDFLTMTGEDCFHWKNIS